MNMQRLLSLPTEICLQKYRYLLIQPLPIRPQGLSIFRHKFEPYLEHNLLRTCRQIYDEALPLLYGENVFCDHVDDYSGRLLRIITKSKVFPAIMST